jgi:dihydrofolate reductase
MGKVIAEAAVSLDGFVADRADAVGPLFDWYNNGDMEVVSADPDRVFHTSAASAEYLRSWENVGAAVIGRRLFDLTDGWGGRPAAGDAVFVVTHAAPSDWSYPDAPFTFVTDGLPSAIAQARAHAGEGGGGAAGGERDWEPDRSSVAMGTGRRAVGQPGPGYLRGGHPVLRGLCRRSDPARQPDGRARRSGDASALPRANAGVNDAAG